MLTELVLLLAPDISNWKDERHGDLNPLWNLSLCAGDFEFDASVERPDAIANPSFLSYLEGNIFAGLCANRLYHPDVPDRWCLAATGDWYGD